MKKINITINPDETYQEIHHFGASAAWWAQEIGKWPDNIVSDMADLLFDREKGIGLNLIRYNLGGGKENAIITDPLRKAETIEISPGVFDLSRDQAAIGVIDKAVERGAEVVLFANSPPDRLTVTGAPTGNGKKTNLLQGKEQEFVQYLVDAAEFLKKEKLWPIHEISPINEPQWDWAPKKGQEGCYYNAEEAYRVIRALYDELKERKLDYSISAIDSAEMKLSANKSFIDKIFSDTELREAIDHYAVHSYWSSGINRSAIYKYMQKNYPEVELWMTEWTEMKGGRDLSMDSAINLAATVHEDMVYTNASSWQYWIAVSPYNYRDGLIYMNSIEKNYEVPKRLWALGNWSRFINPGARRVEASVSQKNSILVSSFKNVDGSLVSVLVNMNKSKERLISFDEMISSDVEMEIYETSETKDLELIYRGGIKETTVPPFSIQTVVIKRI